MQLAGRRPFGSWVRQFNRAITCGIDSNFSSRIACRTSACVESVQPHIGFIFGAAE
jgi:hypothetical protein